MNLKEAFRYQNKLGSLMEEAQSILGLEGNITRIENTYPIGETEQTCSERAS